MKKIAVITGNRADYGLLRNIMREIELEEGLKLQIVATGSHFSGEYGNTYMEIMDEGFSIDEKVEMLLSSDSDIATSKSMGLGVIGLSEAFSRLRPDIILLVGDRYEMLSAATAALILRIPMAHIHGGELTTGQIDDAIRHCLTKMSQIHFVAADAYKKRVVQMGEDPERVFVVGGLGIDNIISQKLLQPEELEKELGITYSRNNFLITFHPETLRKNAAEEDVGQLLTALAEIKDASFFFTSSNSDMESSIINKAIKNFVSLRERSWFFESLGQYRYLSLAKSVDAIIGNSSSGLLEAPSLKIPTVNIGNRQSGRLKASSVVDCQCVANEIIAAIKNVLSAEFKDTLKRGISNPYGEGGSSRKIVRQLKSLEIKNLLVKNFYENINY